MNSKIWEGAISDWTLNRNSDKSKFFSDACGDGDHVKQIKKLSDQLDEEEVQRVTLQEQLMNSIHTSNELEKKLKNKAEEIKHLKLEWENESRKSEEEIQTLKDRIKKKIEDEKRLKSEISNLESCISTMESDLANAVSDRGKLERELELSLNQYAAYEIELREAKKANSELAEVLMCKEQELLQLREDYIKIYKNEKDIDVSFTNVSFNTSISVPENMGIVVEKVLQEKIEENDSLKDTINKLMSDKNKLLEEIERIKNAQMEGKSALDKLQFLNEELSMKMETFESCKEELCKTQKELISVNNDVNKLMKENEELKEKCKVLNSKVVEQEQTLIDYKNSKMFIHFDILKLARNFKAVQKRLEVEVNNIMKLTSDMEENCLVNNENQDSPMESQDCHVEQVYNIYRALLPAEISSPSIFNSKVEKFLEYWNSYDDYNLDWHESKISMQKACSQLNDSIVTLKLKVVDLENYKKNLNEEKMKLIKSLEGSERKMEEIKNLHSSEIEVLKAKLKEKERKVFELEKLLFNLQDKKIKLPLEKSMSPTVSIEEQKNDETKNVECSDSAKMQTGQATFPLSPKNQILTKTQTKDEFEDSLEEIPFGSRTFEIVNLDDRTINNKTFLITRKVEKGSPEIVSNECKFSTITAKNNAQCKKSTKSESWVIPLNSEKEKPKQENTASVSINRLTTVESHSNLTKSSSLSYILEVQSTPPSKKESKSSDDTYFSITESDSFPHKGNTKKLELRRAYSSEICLQNVKPTISNVLDFVKGQDDPLREIFRQVNSENDHKKKLEWEKKFSQMRKEIIELSKECERLRESLHEADKKRKKEKESYERHQDIIVQNITQKYENQLSHLKNEMKQLYNGELSKYKNEQSKMTSELREQNKRYKQHIDQLRNQLWDLGDKLLQEEKLKRDLERSCNELKKELWEAINTKGTESKSFLSMVEKLPKKEPCQDDRNFIQSIRQLSNTAFPTIPNEDEEEVFDNRFLEDMKKGVCLTEIPERRLMELQNRNTLCLPHLKSSYPAETQFHNPSLFKESELKFGLLQFGQESQSLTDSDQSMTRSLLPKNKGKKKDQTSYKKPGPPTPSKHGGRLSMQSGDLRITPRSVLKDLNDQNEVTKDSPSRFKKILKSDNVGGKDENTAPVTPRKKFGKLFSRKPFGARDH